MKISIDNERDIVRIMFSDAAIEESDRVLADVIYDYHAHGHEARRIGQRSGDAGDGDESCRDLDCRRGRHR